MSWGALFMDWGLELELRGDITEVTSLLDDTMSDFTYDGYTYSIGSSKGVMGSNWKLLVKLQDRSSFFNPEFTIGSIELEGLDNGYTNLKIPPRDQWKGEDTSGFDEDGKFFSGFVYHLLNTFQDRSIIDLPGYMPIR